MGRDLLDSLRGPTHIWNFILALHFAIQSSALPPKATAMAPQILQGAVHRQPHDHVHALRRRNGALLRPSGGRSGRGAGHQPHPNLAELVVLIVQVAGAAECVERSRSRPSSALGVGGLAVALALQDTLSNLFGFYISVAGQMRLGDYIKLNTGEEGYLNDIGWRSTAILAGANNMIIVPNAKLAQAIVTNYSLRKSTWDHPSKSW